MVGGVIVAALGMLGLVLVEIIKGRNSRTTTTPNPTSPVLPASKDIELYERTAVHNQRLDDGDERHHLLDKVVHMQHDVLDDHGDRLVQHDDRISRLERQMRIHDGTGRD